MSGSGPYEVRPRSEQCAHSLMWLKFLEGENFGVIRRDLKDAFKGDGIVGGKVSHG